MLSDGQSTIAGSHLGFEKCSWYHDTARKERERERGRCKASERKRQKKNLEQSGFVLFSAKNLAVCKNKADTEADTRQGKIISSHFLRLLFPSSR